MQTDSLLKAQQRAVARVGTLPRQLLEWALHFAMDDPKKWSPGEMVQKRLELGIFQQSEHSRSQALQDDRWVPVKRTRVFLAAYPKPSEVLRARERLSVLLKLGMDANFVTRESTVVQMGIGKDGKAAVAVYFYTGSISYTMHKFMTLYAEFHELIKRCPETGRHASCSGWFVGEDSRSEYCSKRCGARARKRRERKGAE